MNPLLLTDGYKTGHHLMYPPGTELVYSNFTPRSNKYGPEGVNNVVVFGTQMLVRQLKEVFDVYFFHQDKDEVIAEIKADFSSYLGADYDTSHFEDLHDLRYLPVIIKSLPEGTLCPIGVPMLTIQNTLPEFFWITNYLETIISNLLWKPVTSATIAREYRILMEKYVAKTDPDNDWLVPFMGHDFSMRGMDSVGATISSGLGHALFFRGSDSLPVIYGARKYYGASKNESPINSVNATEHSVMSSGTGLQGELETFRRLLRKFPSGILSVVSDTFDLWEVCTTFVSELKDEILAREGKLVIRPDSGDPVDILCGNNMGKVVGNVTSEAEKKGVIELLWDVFGGTINEQGYKVLDSHIGAIYGDSITLDRAQQIYERLEEKGFAATNVVLGIGSFTYQFNTRDTFGMAMKATYCEVNHQAFVLDENAGNLGDVPPPSTGIYEIPIFKDPVTDDGTKKSAKGLLSVKCEDGKYILEQEVDKNKEEEGCLKTIFFDGLFINSVSFERLREIALETCQVKEYSGAAEQS